MHRNETYLELHIDDTALLAREHGARAGRVYRPPSAGGMEQEGQEGSRQVVLKLFLSHSAHCSSVCTSSPGFTSFAAIL